MGLRSSEFWIRWSWALPLDAVVTTTDKDMYATQNNYIAAILDGKLSAQKGR